jgi:hypothetical protein
MKVTGRSSSSQRDLFRSAVEENARAPRDLDRVAHGQMHERRLERVMLSFSKGDRHSPLHNDRETARHPNMTCSS